MLRARIGQFSVGRGTLRSLCNNEVHDQVPNLGIVHNNMACFTGDFYDCKTAVHVRVAGSDSRRHRPLCPQWS